VSFRSKIARKRGKGAYAEEDGGTVVERHSLPLGLSTESGLNGLLGELGSRGREGGEGLRVVVGHRLGGALGSRENLFVASPSASSEAEKKRGRGRTALPPTKAGTSKGAAASISARASARALRSGEPGA
jgi:hypothetical protein